MEASTRKKDNGNRASVGRPAIGKFTAVRLPPEMLERIDAFAGPGRRAEFIREAVERELKRREEGGG